MGKKNENLATKRLHKKKVMNCGQECEIVAYRGSTDIDVKFLVDGQVVCHRSYDDFLRGAIKNPNITCDLKQREKRLNTRMQMSSGLWAFVCEYRGASDIDVQFEIDGAVSKNKRWKDFLRGKIAHPSVAPNYDLELHMNEVREMRNGMLAQVVAYRGSKDVDIRFVEDLALVTNITIGDFLSGKIAHPTIKTIFDTSLQEFAIAYYLEPLGFRKIEKGEWKDRGFGRYELDLYNESINVAIECDGAIHNKEGCMERDVDKNLKCKQLGVTLYRLRDPYLKPMDDGVSINYVLDKAKRVNSNLIIDCKIELEEILRNHGVEINDDYINFQRDIDDIFTIYKDIYVNNRGAKYEGQTSFGKSANQTITLVKYHNSRKVDIEFEDGQRVNGISMNAFRKGRVLHPLMTRSDIAQQIADREDSLISRVKKKSKEQAAKRIHAKAKTNDGYDVEIIEYNGSKDVVVAFSDGSIIKTNYFNFKNGSIRYPTKNHLANERINKTTITNEGYEIKIVAYRSATDMDVLFTQDGVYRYNVRYSEFKNGAIAHPNTMRKKNRPTNP